MEELYQQDCNCGGTCVFVKGKDRKLPSGIPIGDYFSVLTCLDCGETYFNEAEVEAIERAHSVSN
jgi:hypothetical protein